MQSYKPINIKINDNSILLSPAGTTYNRNVMIKIFEDIFKEYKNRSIYVKLHPAERYVEDIKGLIDRYSNVILLDDNSYTSEDFLMNKAITTIISDYSSTLINAYYLRTDLQLISYIEELKDKYKIDLGLKISIFDKLLYKGNIEQIKL